MKKLIVLILLFNCNKGIKELITKGKEMHWEYIKENKARELKEYLENNSVDFNFEMNETGETMLTLATKCSSLDVLNLLLNQKGIEVDKENSKRQTALILAILRIIKMKNNLNKYSIENKLTEKIDNIEKDHHELLIIEQYKNRYLEIIKMLLDKGANVNYESRDHSTPLMLASKNGQIEIIKELIEKNAIIEKRDKGGWTALMLAAQNGHIEVVKILLERGANARDKWNNGWTALMLACQEGNIEVVKLLIEKGAEINDKTITGWTALTKASQGGHIEIVKILLERGANVNYKDKDGDDALIKASYSGNIEIIKLLIEKGSDINLENNYGESAFFYVILSDNFELNRDFIKAGLNIYKEYECSKTPIIYISEKLNTYKKNIERYILIDTAYLIIERMLKDYIQLFTSLNKNTKVPRKVKDDVISHINLLYSLRKLPIEVFEEVIIGFAQ